MDGDVRAHAVELADVHEAVLEDVFGDGAGAFGLGHQGHELGLHVRGETGVFFGIHVGCDESAAGVNTDVVLTDFKFDTRLLEFSEQ